MVQARRFTLVGSHAEVACMGHMTMGMATRVCCLVTLNDVIARYDVLHGHRMRAVITCL